MGRIDLNDFYNDGYGWVCRHCERELAEEPRDHKHSRLMREGEHESKNLKLSNPALAKWLDRAQQILTCPRCGITEYAEK